MIKLAVRLFDHAEVSHVELVVKQLQNRVKDGFVLSSSAEADAILISPNDPGFDALVNSRSSKRPVVYGSDNGSSRYRYFLRKPATTNGLLELLAELGSGRQAPQVIRPEEAIRFGPFLNAVLRAARSDQYSTLSGEHPVIHINPQGKCALLHEALLHQQRLSPAFAGSVGRTEPRLQWSTTEDFAAAAATNAFRQMDLELLIWLVAGASGHDMALAPQQTLKLKHWPDYGRLPYQRSYLKLTALLTRRPYSLDQLSRASELSEADLLPFLCACAALDLLDTTAAKNLPNRANGPVVEKTTLSKIVNRFFSKTGN